METTALVTHVVQQKGEQYLYAHLGNPELPSQIR